MALNGLGRYLGEGSVSLTSKEERAMGYREEYFKHNKGRTIPFRRGTWYQCVRCGRWFPKSEITVDHRIPKRKGGTDDLWNLQPMCRSCNSSKRDRNSKEEVGSTMVRAAFHGDLGKAVGGVVKRKVKDVFGVKYRRE